MKSLIAALLALGLVGSAAQAATLVADDFEIIGKGEEKNFNNFLNFTVTDGTVDYIRTGIYGLKCAGGTGGCVDLDGSSGAAGTMTSNPFAVTAGSGLTISFDLAGNGRINTSDSVVFGIAGLFEGAIDNIAFDQVFTTYTYSFLAPVDGQFSFFIRALGGDYYGPLLDNVRITASDVPAVPLPATLPLLAGAFGAFALWRRKRA